MSAVLKSSYPFDADGKRVRQSEPGWLVVEEAAKRLCVSVGLLGSASVARVVRRKRSWETRKKAGSFRGIGALWHEGDVMRLVRVKRECHLSLAQAVRVLSAMNEERI